MAKYRKKPIIIEAEQWQPGKEVEGVILYQPEDVVIGGRGHGEQRFPQDPYPAIETLEGVMRVTPGDWIITGVKGERYPCKDDIFRATYAPVSEWDQPGKPVYLDDDGEVVISDELCA